MSTILFSGRYDRLHIGHVTSLMRLAERYDKVLVVILDYPQQEFSVAYRRQLLEDVLRHAKGNYEVMVNKTHFAKITKKELGTFDFDVYGAGNHDCLKHIESLGFKVEYVERAYDYAATDDRTMGHIRKALEQG